VWNKNGIHSRIPPKKLQEKKQDIEKTGFLGAFYKIWGSAYASP
jgi:hypothetical protein